MELSINFIVILILSIVMFGTGITLTYKIINNANLMQQDLSENIKQQIEQEMMRSGSTINIPETTKEINKGEHDIFAIGMRNTHKDAKSFKILVSFWKAFREDKTTICDTSTGNSCKDILGNWWIDTNKVYKIGKNQVTAESIFFRVPKKDLLEETIMPGTYIFIVEVNAYKDESGTNSATPKNLGEPMKIYIIIKK